jgi:hypothetical protein
MPQEIYLESQRKFQLYRQPLIVVNTFQLKVPIPNKKVNYYILLYIDLVKK